jgi:hypothetical protein
VQLQRVVETLQRWRATERWQRHSPLLWVLGPALWVVAPLRNQTPLSYDHATHLFKAWHFWNEMLGQGRLRGWSNFWGFGFPSDELVPFGGELWVCLFRALSLGQLSWTRSYALAFAGLLIFRSLAAYFFTRRYFGATAGVLCSWLALFDPGSMLRGGWIWHTYYGVWPVELSMCLVLVALLFLEKVFEQRSARVVLWTALLFCATLLSHQLALIVFLVTAPLFLLEHFLRSSAAPLSAFVLVIGALLLGGALAAFSFIPFMARSGHAQDLGWLGDSLAAMSQRLLELRSFENVWYPVHGLALLGAWFALRERRPGGVFMAASAAAFVFLSSDTLVNDLHLERALPTLLKIETDRMLVAAKLFWFPLAGYGFARALSLPIAPQNLLSRGKRVLGWAVAIVLGGLLIVPGLPQLYEAQLKKEFVTEQQAEHWDDYQAFYAWFEAQPQPPNEFFRIAYHFRYGHHLSTLSPVFTHRPMYKIGYTPTQIFNALPTTDEPELLQALSVKYVLAGYPLERSDLSLEQRFGQLWLYRCTSYDPHPFHLNGPGQGELLEFSPERVRIRVSGTSQDSRLVLHVANYDRWQATLGGELLPIHSVPVYGIEYPFLMEVPARDGELVFRYVYRRAEWLGLLITLAALPAFLGLVWLSRHSSLPERALAGVARLRWPLLAGALTVLLLSVVIMARRTRSLSRLLPKDSLFQELDGPELSLDGEPCYKSKALRFECGGQELQAEVLPGVWGIHPCMTTSSAGELKLSGELPLGSFLAGKYDPRKQGDGSIRLVVDGQLVGETQTRAASLRAQYIEFDTRAYQGRRAQVELTLTGAALYCFDLRRVP